MTNRGGFRVAPIFFTGGIATWDCMCHRLGISNGVPDMTHYAHIENGAAYEAAKWANIRRNRAKTARAKWLAERDDAQTLYEIGRAHV